MRVFMTILISLLLISCSNNSDKKQKGFEGSSINTVDCNLKTTKFLGRGHRRMYEAWQKGGIKTSDYESFVKAKIEQYNNLLRQTDLTQYNVCAAGLGDYNDFILRETSIPERIKCMRILSVALKENRVTYMAGEADGIYGTVITISQKIDENGKIIDDEGGRLIRLFIPGLFKNSVKESFDSVAGI